MGQKTKQEITIHVEKVFSNWKKNKDFGNKSEIEIREIFIKELRKYDFFIFLVLCIGFCSYGKGQEFLKLKEGYEISLEIFKANTKKLIESN